MGASSERILLVDDDAGLARTLRILLEEEGGYAVDTVHGGQAALEHLGEQSGTRLVITDLSMPGMSGIELLAELRLLRPELPVILMTAYGSVKSAVEAMKGGAFQYLTKPVEPDELLVQVGRALEHGRLRAENRQLRARAGDPDRYDELVGDSGLVRDLRRTVARVAAVDSTLLIRGETGTGKELVARLVHRQSARASGPFVAINCTAIPDELLESELFGYEKGAFTSAGSTRIGRLEEAEGGTLLLDEIGDMPASLQPKMLRFLEDRRVRRLGGQGERRVNVRVLASTHRDLGVAIAEGAFRQDLYFRLATVPLELPPLRDHLDDLPALCEHLLAKIARRVGRSRPSIDGDALELLGTYAFPGNVRELENMLERAVVLGGGGADGEPGAIRARDLRPAFGADDGPGLTRLPIERGMTRLDELHAELERDLIARALERWADLPNEQIARRLGTNRRILELRMKHYDLAKPGARR